MSSRLRLVGRYFATASESEHTVRKKPHWKLQRRLVLMPFERVTASKSTCPDRIQTNWKSWNRGLNSGTLGNDSKNPAEIIGGKYCNPNSRCELRSPRVTHGSREKLNHHCASRTLQACQIDCGLALPVDWRKSPPVRVTGWGRDCSQSGAARLCAFGLHPLMGAFRPMHD